METLKKVTWIKDKEWRGNPSLEYDSYSKKFGKYHVTIFGNEKRENPKFANWWYVVKGEYSGGFPLHIETIEQAQTYLDNKYIIQGF